MWIYIYIYIYYKRLFLPLTGGPFDRICSCIDPD